jgi:hypothetical protein
MASLSGEAVAVACSCRCLGDEVVLGPVDYCGAPDEGWVTDLELGQLPLGAAGDRDATAGLRRSALAGAVEGVGLRRGCCWGR